MHDVVRSPRFPIEPAPGPPEIILRIRNLRVRFRSARRTVYAVNGVSFDVRAGETVGLVGESGSGKSVTGLSIMRLLPDPPARVEADEISFRGTELLRQSESGMRSLRGGRIAMVFQDALSSLNPVLTVESQIVEALQSHQRLTRREARLRAIQLVEDVGIPNPAETVRRYPHQFSGGMAQRVMIAMALAHSPDLLIADEPTTALDVTTQAQVLELISGLSSRMGTAVILITHDLGVVAGLTDRVLVMYAGYVVESATTDDVFDRPSHPYTVGLLHSIPRQDQPRAQLVPIEGAPPDQQSAPVGCPFAPRCKWRLEACWQSMPELAPMSTRAPDHAIACHNPPTREEASEGQPRRSQAGQSEALHE